MAPPPWLQLLSKSSPLEIHPFCFSACSYRAGSGWGENPMDFDLSSGWRNVLYHVCTFLITVHWSLIKKKNWSGWWYGQHRCVLGLHLELPPTKLSSKVKIFTWMFKIATIRKDDVCDGFLAACKGEWQQEQRGSSTRASSMTQWPELKKVFLFLFGLICFKTRTIWPKNTLLEMLFAFGFCQWVLAAGVENEGPDLMQLTRRFAFGRWAGGGVPFSEGSVRFKQLMILFRRALLQLGLIVSISQKSGTKLVMITCRSGLSWWWFFFSWGWSPLRWFMSR